MTERNEINIKSDANVIAAANRLVGAKEQAQKLPEGETNQTLLDIQTQSMLALLEGIHENPNLIDILNLSQS